MWISQGVCALGSCGGRERAVARRGEDSGRGAFDEGESHGIPGRSGLRALLEVEGPDERALGRERGEVGVERFGGSRRREGVAAVGRLWRLSSGWGCWCP